MTTGDVEITVLDGGAGSVVVPASTVQVVIGVSSAGTAAAIVASRNANTLATAVGVGPGPEAAALAILAGGTVLFMRAATVTPGANSAVVSTAWGTSVLTVSGTPNDCYLVKVKVVQAGTIGAVGCRIQISLDAGRTYGPPISLGTAVLYAIAGTGITLNFAAGTLLLAGYSTFGCTEPLTDNASILACLTALQASQYAVAGWGSMHIVGARTGANATTINGYLNTLATGYVFTRAIIGVRDAALPAAYGGAGETDSVWSAAVALDYSAVDAKRIDAVAGHYNVPSAYPIAAAGAPRYRRSGAFVAAARQVTIPAQRHAGRVRDGALSQIAVDPTLDPSDGFIYHDERTAPALDAARFTSFRTRIGLPGFYMANPNLMSAPGSVFTLLPLGNVMDVGCSLAHQVGQQDINEDIRLNDNGTIFENEAQAIESSMHGQIDAQMTAKNMISSATVAVDRSNNVRATSEVNVAITLFSRGYILQENVTIGFASPFAAGG
jgi:hypothetical protein